MSVESDQFKTTIGDLTRERDQIVPFIQKLQTDLVNTTQALNDAIAAGATDKEIADAARGALPGIQQVVSDLDQFTPDNTPTL